MTSGASVPRSSPFSDFGSKAFLSSHRATAVCAREVGVFSKRLITGAVELHTGGIADEPVIRQSPGRCIVQLGPVAITAAWLCSSHDTIDQGELLVIVWRGTVAPPIDVDPERTARRSPSSATSLWEESFRPVGTSEETWTWYPKDASLSYNSSDLAVRCLERLRLAHEDIADGPQRIASI